MDLNKFGSEIACQLEKLPQEDRLKILERIFIDMMDYTEQSDEEEVWIKLYDLVLLFRLP